MNGWLLAAVLGFGAVGAILGFAWLRGVSPRRLIWQDFSRVRIPAGDELVAVRANVKTSLVIYLPLLAMALLLGGLLMLGGSPLGLAVLIGFGVPALLAVIRAVRVMRFLSSLG